MRGRACLVKGWQSFRPMGNKLKDLSLINPVEPVDTVLEPADEDDP
jgi:hypothetical protein